MSVSSTVNNQMHDSVFLNNTSELEIATLVMDVSYGRFSTSLSQSTEDRGSPHSISLKVTYKTTKIEMT